MSEERTRIYGIANCDTMKKARSWLDARNIDYDFHDYRKQGLDEELLQLIESKLGWENMLNRRGTTWRKLPEDVRNDLDRASALRVMLDNPAIIRRPILAREQQLYIGFDENKYRGIFA